MKKQYAITSNARRFLAGVAALEARGAPEASWLLLTGLPGLGKTKMVEWFCVQEHDGLLPAVYLRAKTTWTPRLFLRDLNAVLGTTPAWRKDDLFGQAVALLTRNPHLIVVDEVDHCLRNVTILESLRDLTDYCETPAVLVGMESVRTKIQRYEQISSRITQVVEFTPCGIEDIATMAHTLTDLRFDEDLLRKILEETEGRYRLVMDALAVVERQACRNGWKRVEASQFPQRLVHDWRLRTRRRQSASIPYPSLS